VSGKSTFIEVMHWKSIHENPNAPEVQRFLRQTLEQRKKGRVENGSEFLQRFVKGASVLDVGVVQHDISQADRPHWKHGKIRSWSRRCVGVDILSSQVEELNRRGFDVRCVDATSDLDLGERFERVVLGDVLEHVDSPVALLRFARRHLADGGLVLCTTPNPFFINYVIEGLRRGSFIPNAEHVGWITPTMALELAHRADLQLHEYWHAQGNGKTLARKAVVELLSLLGIRDAEPFTLNFYYVFSRPIEPELGA
jgi:2-polyprenyl-3-methyl-5-hydroxy-6-metoxy-1,4-benzoquinol methylase